MEKENAAGREQTKVEKPSKASAPTPVEALQAPQEALQIVEVPAVEEVAASLPLAERPAAVEGTIPAIEAQKVRILFFSMIERPAILINHSAL